MHRRRQRDACFVLTASKELRDLTHARDLMRHRNPSGDLAVVLDQALDLLIAKLEKERLGKTTRPREVNDAPTAASTESRTLRNVRTVRNRNVRATSGEASDTRSTIGTGISAHQCTFVDAEGRRCTSRAFLEIDHIVSRALGGSDEVENLRIRCRAHDRLHAEHVFGREHVERQICLRQRKRDATKPAERQIDLRQRKRDATKPAERQIDLRQRKRDAQPGASGEPAAERSAVTERTDVAQRSSGAERVAAAELATATEPSGV